MAHQYMPKILHDPHKNPPALPLTYLMYGSLFDLTFKVVILNCRLITFLNTNEIYS